MYAVVESGSKTFRVKTGDTLVVDRVKTEAGQPFTFDRVVLVSNDGKVSIGQPTVAKCVRCSGCGGAPARPQIDCFQNETPERVSPHGGAPAGTIRFKDQRN